MSKNTYVGIGVGVLMAGLIIGAGFWYMKHHDKSSDNAQETKKTLGSTTNQQGLSLNTGTGSGGLSVDKDAKAASLGQIGGDSTQQNNNGSSQKQTNPFDPATFAQYEKYKDQQNGLYAEALAGSGAELTPGKKAAVYYRGWLTNGQLFDESKKDKDGKLQPFVFELGAHRVIPGWEQALAGMKVGGVRLVIVPPAAGYGAQGQNGIPPNSVLIFQVQLAAVE